MPLKKYYDKDPAKFKRKYMEAYYKDPLRFANYKKKFNSTPAGKKCRMINNWKQRGMKLHPGESWSDMFATFKAQNFCCGCGISFDEKRKALDHDHCTGLVRGVLCYSCNKLDILANL